MSSSEKSQGSWWEKKVTSDSSLEFGVVNQLVTCLQILPGTHGIDINPPFFHHHFNKKKGLFAEDLKGFFPGAIRLLANLSSKLRKNHEFTRNLKLTAKAPENGWLE